jgi:3-phosphoinositide dependent protein kinase-1
MLTGKSPFKAATDYLIFQKIKNLEYTIPSDMAEVGKDLVQKLLQSDPEQRLSIAAIKSHAFFDGMDWDSVYTSNAPALKERLEKEAQPAPTFDFGHDDDDEDDEDIWVEPKKVNPFHDPATTRMSSVPERLGAHPPW